jgi:hypothetical protein
MAADVGLYSGMQREHDHLAGGPVAVMPTPDGGADCVMFDFAENWCPTARTSGT